VPASHLTYLLTKQYSFLYPRPWASSEYKQSSVIWVGGQSSLTYCCYLSEG